MKSQMPEDEKDEALQRKLHNAGLRQYLSEVRANQEIYIELECLHAQRMGAKLAAFLEAGFERSEALHILVARGLS